jgi:hypothetical protein
LLVVHPASAITPIQIESNLDRAVPGVNVIFTITDNTNGNSVFLQYRDPGGNLNDIGLISEKSKQPVNYIWETKGLISGVYTFYAYDSSRTVFASAPVTIEKGYISMNLAGNKVSYSPGDTVRVSGIGLGQKFIR